MAVIRVTIRTRKPHVFARRDADWRPHRPIGLGFARWGRHERLGRFDPSDGIGDTSLIIVSRSVTRMNRIARSTETLLFVFGSIGCVSSHQNEQSSVGDAIEEVSDTQVGPEETASGSERDILTDRPAGDTDEPGLVGGDADGTDHLSDNVLVPPVPWGPENRGYRRLRGIVHAHSIHSHDGCAQDAPPLGSVASLQCLAEMRAAPCQAGIDFLMLTDHPANVAHTPFLDALHYQPQNGDAVMKDEEERPLANRVLCPTGSLVDRFFFYVGTEGGSKNMPVALSGPIPPEVFSTGYADKVPLELAQAAIAQVHALGGVALAAHTEEDDISVERIVALPLDGIEMYNFHANILKALDNFDRLLLLDRFMGAPGPDRPLADLSLLTFLQPITRTIEKFDQAAPFVHLIHVAANDVHRNVEFPVMCPDGVRPDNLCGTLSESGYPEFAAFLATGGPFPLNDGDRLDSYVRSYRWFSNHLWATSDDPDRIRQTLRRGRHFSAFDGLGEPRGFDFFAVQGAKVFEMGDEVTFGEDTTLYLRAPTVSEPPWGLPRVDDFSMAEVTTRLIRATPGGSQVVLVRKGQGATAAFPVTGPGVYRVECDIVPRHLKPALPGVEELADNPYPYLYSNAIFIRE